MLDLVADENDETDHRDPVRAHAYSYSCYRSEVAFQLRSRFWEARRSLPLRARLVKPAHFAIPSGQTVGFTPPGTLAGVNMRRGMLWTSGHG